MTDNKMSEAAACSDEPSRDEIVKWNLRVFLPYVIQCVPATMLLTHLTCFDKDERKEIFTLHCHQPHKASQLALQTLLNKTDDLGLFIALLDAIQLAGYPKIVDILSGKHVQNDQYEEKILHLFTATIIQQLHPLEILPHLIKYSVIGEEEKEEVRAEDMNHGSIRASYVLLAYLPSRQENWLRLFMMALIDSRHENLAEILEPDIFAKLMAQRNDGHDKTETNVAVLDCNRVDDNNEMETEVAVLEYHSGLDFNDLLDDQPNNEDITNKELNGENKLSKDGEKASDKDSNVDADKDIDEAEVKFDSLTDVKQRANMSGNKKLLSDGRITYDRTFLLSLRISPLANYISADIRKYPEISLISSENGEAYGGARPKVRQMKIQNVTPSNVLNNNTDESKKLGDLAKELDDLLLGSLKIAEPCDSMNALTGAEIIYNRSESYEDNDDEPDLCYNITTDDDRIDGVEDQDVPLREYQKELAKEGMDGENVIIMAPTNSGKTRVATRIIQTHLRRQKREGRIASVIFLVQDEVLAIQQAKSFAEHLPAYRTKIISGTTQRDKKEFLKDFINRRDILVVTAQVLINALENKEIKDLTRFTMMVFDECHHSNKNHPYNQILSRYMDLKILQNVDINELPQIVGMTASLGCGGNLDIKPAMLHMKKVMANMDAKCLCTIRRNIDELKHYVNPPIEEIRQVNVRTDNGFEIEVNKIIDQISQFMAPQLAKIPGCKVPQIRGTEQFRQWLADFVKEIAKINDETAARVLNPCRHNLDAYNMLLLVYQDARVKDAMRIIDLYMMGFKLQEEKDETDNYLIQLYEGLKLLSFEDEPENPKLLEMQRIVDDELGRDEDARGIIFVKTIELAKALAAWMNDTDGLREYRAEEFVGQGKAAYKGGSTKTRQKDAMEYFKNGNHRILVATSVAEEGLDISKCNLVIRYEHVTNEIVRLQSRGRARAADSKYFVLTETGSRIVAKEEKNQLLENLMNKLVPHLQVYIEDHQNLWEAEMRQIQQDQIDEELRRKKEKEEAMIDTPVSIQCMNCHTEICKSTDIKKIQNCHHVIIGKEAAKRFLFFPNPIVAFMDEDVQYHGSICCVKCHYDVGGICEYKHTMFPLLQAKRFRDENGRSFKKWKEVPYKLERFTLDDLRDVVDQRGELLEEE